MNVTSPRSVKYKIYKDEQYKKALKSYNGKTLEPSRGAERKDFRCSTDDPRFGCVTLISKGDPCWLEGFPL